LYYDITYKYWKYEGQVLAVTDDLMWARSFLLDRADYYGMGADGPARFACFEDLWSRFESGVDSTMYFSFRDHYFSIRPSQLRVVIGGLSTI
jgi:hypothetical protein